jgi:hypothetical protein
LTEKSIRKNNNHVTAKKDAENQAIEKDPNLKKEKEGEASLD